jgi:ABC-2 type transport system ATP-binding protein
VAGEIALELARASKRWRGGAALDGVDLVVRRGTIVGLVGPSGAGKTTALRVGLGLLEPDSGSARVFGDPAAKVARHSGRVGLLLDGPALEGGLTVDENLVLHALRHGRATPDASGLLDTLDVGSLRQRRAARLSQGEAYRVALVRALLLEPDLLVLDEPVAHLDPTVAATALELLSEAALQRGAAILVSSHQLAELERAATHLVLLHKGRVLVAGELKALLGHLAPVIRIVARPLDRARELLARHPGVAHVELVRAEGTEMLRVELAGDSAASVNAALHQGGVEVSLLAPERPTIEELFRRTLADAVHAAHGAPAEGAA